LSILVGTHRASIGGGPLEAWCLSGDGSYAGRYSTERMVCDKWARNDLGAIDDPEWERADADPIEHYAEFDRHIEWEASYAKWNEGGAS